MYVGVRAGVLWPGYKNISLYPLCALYSGNLGHDSIRSDEPIGWYIGTGVSNVRPSSAAGLGQLVLCSLLTQAYGSLC